MNVSLVWDREPSPVLPFDFLQFIDFVFLATHASTRIASLLRGNRSPPRILATHASTRIASAKVHKKWDFK